MSRFLFYSLALFTFHVQASSFDDDIVNALIYRTTQPVTYDGAYHQLEYPGGDVPANIGVCTDVLIRSYRQLGVDLQKLVHEDMQNNFRAYPSKRIWGLTKPDKNIDHRRVPNLQVYFERHAKVLTKSLNAEDYKAGDIVTWMLPGNLPHIGMVVNEIAQGSGNPLIVHNIGRGPEMSDMLFAYTITGHYRFVPAKYSE
ncbi:DUF1287 domain-containing protein [Pseudoalteromonas sp. Scap03]|uniref:DUF1287 domain-containing protein n=1 Tax=unclassified Pseudoalteromonas TaxID=194690 RepID=UPI0015B7AD09|nr:MULTISPECIES: DUF1287 domain-containing protein [unclassified Pseudoalteromonas]NWL16243.1 DUF1287 domain-containing protein [Pseudoalteromonas sp. Scap03]QLE81366.1 DUF1287 domain-containing protein [Pseudoalteromonas sp. Scap25]QLE89310.1 DUF1287 domain-containing protein [Pseudoalteromonas sp. Scap06]